MSNSESIYEGNYLYFDNTKKVNNFYNWLMSLNLPYCHLSIVNIEYLSQTLVSLHCEGPSRQH